MADQNPQSSPSTKATSPPPSSSLAQANSNVTDFATSASTSKTPRPPTLKQKTPIPSLSGSTPATNPLGSLNAARRPAGTPRNSGGADQSARGAQLPQDLAAKMKAFHLGRQGAPSAASLRMPNMPDRPPFPQSPGSSGSPLPTSPATSSPVAMPPGRPLPPTFNSNPGLPAAKKGLAAKRGMAMGMKLSNASGNPTTPTLSTASSMSSTGSASDSNSQSPSIASSGTTIAQNSSAQPESLFNKFSEYVDTDTGTLNFRGKATIRGSGIEFSSGTKFNISLDEVDTLDELGKGNYGTVFKVRHSRPRIRKPGQGLAGNKSNNDSNGTAAPKSSSNENDSTASSDTSHQTGSQYSIGKVMAMKEIRLELDEAKFAAIIMELDILHRCTSQYIIDFYGAFFQEGAVYICMEYMDGGSIDKIYGNGVPEGVLRKITYATVMGLKCLKDEHNIIHRDVKPTNILVNTRGCVKICDFGVSGNLVASIAKTNIGCQSYMAPERISGGGMSQVSTAASGGGTYSVQSDIWSLGLTIIECALGQYPYPPETYDNIFSQLSAIVDGDPPDLPTDRYSEMSQDFVKGTLNKIPKLRPTYTMLLDHPWLSTIPEPSKSSEMKNLDSADGHADIEVPLAAYYDQEVAKWVHEALERKMRGATSPQKPALHAAPLDALPKPH